MGFIPRNDRLDGIVLMLSVLLLGLELDVIDIRQTELVPVDSALFQVLEPEPDGGNGLIG